MGSGPTNLIRNDSIQSGATHSKCVYVPVNLICVDVTGNLNVDEIVYVHVNTIAN